MHPQTLKAVNLLALLFLSAPSIATDEVSNSSVPMECMSICAPIVELTSICEVGDMTNSNMTSESDDTDTEMSNMDMAKANPMAEMAADTDGAITVMAGDKKKKRAMEEDMEMNDGDDMGDDEMSDGEEEMAEMTCVCENKSFDVAKVMGLCASCMEMSAGSGDTDAVKNVDDMMSMCSFSATSYAPSATSILKDISVQATKPIVTMTGTATGSAAMATGAAAGHVEVATGTFGVGMVITSIGLGIGLILGML